MEFYLKMFQFITFIFVLVIGQSIIDKREVNINAQFHSAEIACLSKHGQFEKINANETMCTVEK